MTVEGYTPPANRGTLGDWQVVTPGYFETMRLTLRDGRLFAARDGMTSPLAMIVNHEFGIRAALGAAPRDLTALGLRAGISQAAAGWRSECWRRCW